MIRVYAIAGLTVALLLAVAANAVQWERGKRHDAECAAQQAAVKAQLAAATAAVTDAARKVEQVKAAAAIDAADAYAKGKHDAETAANGVVDGLRAGTLRLRDEWRGCQARLDGALSGAAAAAGRADAAEQRRGESAGRIVRAAAECDAQVSALQALVRADRAGQP